MSAFEQIKQHIENKQSFVLEAGAGSGKTYTLIETLNHLIETKGNEIQNNNQKIICITYTNVAKNEIIERLEHNPIVLVSTIHEFLWDCIKSYQKQLKIELCKLNEDRYDDDIVNGKDSKYLPNLAERIDKVISVYYNDTAFRDFETGQLHHDDVITLSEMMFKNNTLLTTILTQKYPYILVDEYQDTATETASALVDFLLVRNQNKIVLGFYGDSYQKIYDAGVGDLEKYYTDENSKILQLVKKEENYRSSKEVVRLLNNFRTNIEQTPQKEIEGSVKFVYCKYRKIKTKINNRGREVEDEKKSEYNREIDQQKTINYDAVKSKLESTGWSFDENVKDKILLLVNSRVAKNAGFGNLYTIFSKRFGLSVKEKFTDRNHPLIKIFTGYIDKKTSQEREDGIEHLINFWNQKNYNQAIRFLKKNSNLIDWKDFSHKDKQRISIILDELRSLRLTQTIGEIFEFINRHKLINISDSLNKFLEKATKDVNTLEIDEKEKIKKEIDLFSSFKDIKYEELINFFKHVQNNSVFSTKHGTKGAEYRNVLTVIDDDRDYKNEPDKYNFKLFFDGTDDNEDRKLRTRNLFYVECSRAKENLVVLALSETNDNALANLKGWFGQGNVLSIEEFINS
ncbi:ATP-dependent helicase [Chryseobacterium sp. PS-8]|uniref:ATP-dependent helicase n=1 Tax=Chryseobacterium indicum TaxID=2766954 RepID=A0ABS9C8W4_9FLAO|nr:ATP-dependent helicase [Chryseobacterium sp. PS-8]MCF2221027.1 ATP-dependent helicase [Chryseobacterium sp. PS-8]